jgi:hypothetical protein
MSIPAVTMKDTALRTDKTNSALAAAVMVIVLMGTARAMATAKVIMMVVRAIMMVVRAIMVVARVIMVVVVRVMAATKDTGLMKEIAVRVKGMVAVQKIMTVGRATTRITERTRPSVPNVSTFVKMRIVTVKGGIMATITANTRMMIE